MVVDTLCMRKESFVNGYSSLAMMVVPVKEALSFRIHERTLTVQESLIFVHPVGYNHGGRERDHT